jgi:uncharacterized protein (DUF433 family)
MTQHCVSAIWNQWYNDIEMGDCLPGENARTDMEKIYVEQRDGGYWITGTRISLDSIVYAFKRGAAPESMQRAFPLLTLEEIYGAITFYLAHEQEIDAYLAQAEATFEVQARALNAAARTANPALFQRLEHARHARETTHQ